MGKEGIIKEEVVYNVSLSIAVAFATWMKWNINLIFLWQYVSLGAGVLYF